MNSFELLPIGIAVLAIAARIVMLLPNQFNAGDKAA